MASASPTRQLARCFEHLVVERAEIGAYLPDRVGIGRLHVAHLVGRQALHDPVDMGAVVRPFGRHPELVDRPELGVAVQIGAGGPDRLDPGGDSGEQIAGVEVPVEVAAQVAAGIDFLDRAPLLPGDAAKLVEDAGAARFRHSRAGPSGRARPLRFDEPPSSEPSR